MKREVKYGIGLMAACAVMWSFLTPSSVLARIAEYYAGTTDSQGRIPLGICFLSGLGFLVNIFINVYNTNASMLVEARGFGGSVEASYATTCYTFAGIVPGLVVVYLIQRMKRKVIAFSVVLALIGMFLSFHELFNWPYSVRYPEWGRQSRHYW